MNSGKKLVSQISLINDIKEGRLTKRQHLELHKEKVKNQLSTQKTQKS